MYPTPLNYYGAPSENQALRIEQIVTQRQEELAKVDNNILHIRRLLAQLLRDRSDIRESLEAHKAMIAPPPIPAIERLPPEIWSYIFRACVSETWPSSEYPRMDIDKPPLLLSRVSSTWHKYAISTPQLWSSICIPKRARVSSIPLIETWLGRSGDLQLSIEIRGLSSDFAPELINPFIPYCARWRNLALFASTTTTSKLFANPELTLPSLKTLMLRLSGRPQPISIPSSASQLFSLALIISRSIRPDPLLLNLAWPQLVDLNITSLSGSSLDDTLDVLAQCHSLTHVALSALEGTASLVQRSPLRLPILSSMQLTTGLYDPGSLLEQLELPALLQLDIDFVNMEWKPNVWPKREIISLVSRSTCQLESLIVRNKKIPESDLVEICSCMPTLVHLLVTGTGERKDLNPVPTLELIRGRRSNSGASDT